MKIKKFVLDREFGIEFEMNEKLPPAKIVESINSLNSGRLVNTYTSYTSSYANSDWHVKFDRSCSDVPNVGGWEVASYVAKTYDDIKIFGNLVQALQAAGGMINEQCAFHIHVNIRELKKTDVNKFLAYWIKSEQIILQMLPGYRRRSKYSKLYSTHLPASVEVNKVYDLFKPVDTSNAYRRWAINFCNYEFIKLRPTVELRLPEASFNPDDMKNWIRFFMHFLKCALNETMPSSLNGMLLSEMLSFLGLREPKLVSKTIFDMYSWILRRIMQFNNRGIFYSEARYLTENNDMKICEEICED